MLVFSTRLLGCCKCDPIALLHQTKARPQPPSAFNRMCSDQIPTICYNDQVTGIPKVATQDTTLTVSGVNGGKTTFPVPSGTQVELNVAGLHYNRTLVALCHGSTGFDDVS